MRSTSRGAPARSALTSSSRSPPAGSAGGRLLLAPAASARLGAPPRPEGEPVGMKRPWFVPAACIWGLFGLVAVEILVTYARVPPAQLYHVTGTGAAGGFGRALVFLNY